MSSSTKTILFLVILSSLLALSCKTAATKDSSEVVAKVGSRDIKMAQIDNLIKQQLDQNPGGNPLTSAELAAARLSALDNLIQEEALFQRAQKDNLVPDDNKLNQEIQKQKADASLTEDQFKKMIEQTGLSESDWREQVRRTLAINALRENQRSRVTQPSDEEIKNFYALHQAEFRAERGVDISVIVTDASSNGGPTDAVGDAQAEQKIKSLYERLKAGSDFATLASQESEDSSALKSGSLGFATENQLRQQIFPTRPEVPTRLMTMSPGQYTEPIKDQVSNRWYIFKVNQKIDQPRNLTLNDVSANIINSITQQRQGLLLNALVLVAVTDAGVKNYLAERIVQNPQTIVEMRPSQLLQQATQAPQSSQPRIENQNQPAPTSNRPATTANSNNRPATANANR